MKKGDWVSEVEGEGRVGQVVNVSGDGSVVDVCWNASGEESSVPVEQVEGVSR